MLTLLIFDEVLNTFGGRYDLPLDPPLGPFFWGSARMEKSSKKKVPKRDGKEEKQKKKKNKEKVVVETSPVKHGKGKGLMGKSNLNLINYLEQMRKHMEECKRKREEEKRQEEEEKRRKEEEDKREEEERAGDENRGNEEVPRGVLRSLMRELLCAVFSNK